MVITQLLGGLGNQMFQYAAGRALAARRNTTLRMDTLRLARDVLRPYALGHFAIEGKELSDVEREYLRLNEGPRERFGAIIARLSGRSGPPIVRERSFSFDPSLLEAPATCYLQGYWQSHKYFADIENQVRKEFEFRAPISGRSLELANQIEHCTAVSLHVRRGDYVSNQQTNRYHGTCDSDYYRAAEQYMLDRLGNFRLFVFSDDPAWAGANLRFEVASVVARHNGAGRDYEDMWLISRCQHHIIANSTFSWWGAWLCAKRDKIVVAPRTWFRDAGHSTADLIPEGWIKI